VVVVAVLAAAALTGPALGAPPPKAGPAVVTHTVEIVEQDLDANGRPVGPPRVVPASEHAKHRPTAQDLQASPATEAVPASRTVRSLQGSGCKQVRVARVGRSFFGAVIYKFWQEKAWCWTYPRITSVSVGTQVTDVDINWVYRGLIAESAYFYNWCCGVTTSGHYSLRQGSFENCILKIGCIGKEYPWVKIWVRADGSYAYGTGN
jgi:hypothetical protein